MSLLNISNFETLILISWFPVLYHNKADNLWLVNAVRYPFSRPDSQSLINFHFCCIAKDMKNVDRIDLNWHISAEPFDLFIENMMNLFLVAQKYEKMKKSWKCRCMMDIFTFDGTFWHTSLARSMMTCHYSAVIILYYSINPI